MTTTNTCKKCGCEDSFMPSPAPCPTPAGCPTPQPCSEVFDAQCVVYTGADIECGNDTVVPSNSNVADALKDIVDYVCANIGEGTMTSTISCTSGQTTAQIVLPGTTYNDAIKAVSDFYCQQINNIINNPAPTFYADINQIGELGLTVTLTNGTAPFTYSWTIEQLPSYYAGLSFFGSTSNPTVYMQKVTDSYFTTPGLLRNIYSALVKVKVTDANGQITSAYYNAQAFEQVG